MSAGAGTGTFLEIQPSELAFPCKFVLPRSRLRIELLGFALRKKFLPRLFLQVDLGQSWDLGMATAPFRPCRLIRESDQFDLCATP